MSSFLSRAVPTHSFYEFERVPSQLKKKRIK